MSTERMYDCPKFERCNAPVCPLDPNWRRVPYLRNERVCLWLREASKEGGYARVEGALRADLYEAVVACREEIIQPGQHEQQGRGMLRRELECTALTGSMLASGERLARKGGV